MLLHKDGTVNHSKAPSLSVESGCRIEGSSDPSCFNAELLQQPLIEIVFADFSDGRGYSVSRYLRSTLAYRGTLRAAGCFLPDQLRSLFSVGFDEVRVGESLLARHGSRDWLTAQARCASLNPVGDSTYTEGSVSGAAASIWQQRFQRLA